MIRYTLILLFLFVEHLSMAQHSTLYPLEKMVDQLNKAKSVAYNERMYEKSLFSNDTVVENSHKRLFFDLSSKVIAADIVLQRDSHEARNVFTNKRFYFLASDSTYSMNESAVYSGGFGDLFTNGGIIENIIAYRNKIIPLDDTLINGNPCYHYKIKIQDTLIDGERDFTYKYISIDKKTYLPISSVYKGHGIIMKDGMKIGTVSLYSQSYYNEMKLDIGTNDLIDFKLPNRYRPKDHLALLQAGTTAPVWNGLDINDKAYTSKQFEGQILLLFLSDIICPANQLSISMLNKLTDHYKNRPVQIIGIYPENKKKVNRYLQANPLQFPVLYNGMAIKNAYHSPGAPFFYLIDPKGKIIKSVTGYSTAWQQEFTMIIDRLLTK